MFTPLRCASPAAAVGVGLFVAGGIVTTLDCDVAIIGAGTAGLAAERSARRAGARTLLIDDRFAGTTCTTVGCMPSKLLIAAANAADAVHHAPTFGIDAAAPAIDGPAVLRRLRDQRDAFVASARESYDELPADVRVEQFARFVDRRTLALGDGRLVTAKAIVIATGSAPDIPASLDAVHDRLLTNETLFDLPDLPKSIGVIGTGPLGLEMAQALARLGVDVMVFDTGKRMGGVKDDAIEETLRTILATEFETVLGVELSASASGDGVLLRWSGAATGARHFERLLVSTGRPPRLRGLDLDKTGIALDRHGVPRFDARTLQCDASSIFIAGDADHDRPVLHEASDEGAIAGWNAASFPDVKPGRRRTPLAIMFTEPPMATIGATRDPDDPDQVVGCASYADQGRAKVMDCTDGLIRLYADAKDGRLTGASMIGPGVEHTAHLVAWMVQLRQTASDVLELPFYHPTLEEGLRTALQAICDCVDRPTPMDRDPVRAEA